MLKYLIPFTIFASGAFAQEVPPFGAVQACATMERMAEGTTRYGEKILFNGKILQQHVSGELVTGEFVFTTNQDTGTWTLLSLFPNGWACLVANGTNFEPYVK